MNLFDITKHFSDEETCRNHFKLERDKIGISCDNCGPSSITGLKADGAMSARSAIVVLLCAEERLCKVPICPF